MTNFKKAALSAVDLASLAICASSNLASLSFMSAYSNVDYRTISTLSSLTSSEFKTSACCISAVVMATGMLTALIMTACKEDVIKRCQDDDNGRKLAQHVKDHTFQSFAVYMALHSLARFAHFAALISFMQTVRKLGPIAALKFECSSFAEAFISPASAPVYSKLQALATCSSIAYLAAHYFLDEPEGKQLSNNSPTQRT